MAKLILIKHSLPAIEPGVPAADWRLAPEGERRCAGLAAALAPYLPAALVSSAEPKARATAALLAGHLGLAYAEAAGLEEQHRRGAPFLGEGEFQRTLREFFARPGALVFGEESADAAHDRFAAALAPLLAGRPQQNLMVVTHGTVMSLYVSRRAGVEPFALWARLGLPSFIVLDRATHTVDAIVDTVA